MTDAKEMIKDITIDYLQDTKAGEYLQNVRGVLQQVQEVAYAYVVDDSPQQLKTMRIGTAMAFSIINKVAGGKSIKDFSEQDWKDVASDVSNNAILADGRQWSITVFSIYANYVEASACVLEKKNISKEKCDAVRGLAMQVRDYEKALLNGEISEVDYTEKCLWVLLESMIKLLSTYSMLLVGEHVGEFIQSVSMLAFEYGRYTLYKQEQEILEMYIAHQYKIDEELQTRLDVFNQEMKKRQDEFKNLIDDAFTPDVMQRFRSSVSIARYIGVPENEILSTTEQIDDFFA